MSEGKEGPSGAKGYEYEATSEKIKPDISVTKIKMTDPKSRIPEEQTKPYRTERFDDAVRNAQTENLKGEMFINENYGFYVQRKIAITEAYYKAKEAKAKGVDPTLTQSTLFAPLIEDIKEKSLDFGSESELFLDILKKQLELGLVASNTIAEIMQATKNADKSLPNKGENPTGYRWRKESKLLAVDARKELISVLVENHKNEEVQKIVSESKSQTLKNHYHSCMFTYFKMREHGSTSNEATEHYKELEKASPVAAQEAKLQCASKMLEWGPEKFHLGFGIIFDLIKQLYDKDSATAKLFSRNKNLRTMAEDILKKGIIDFIRQEQGFIVESQFSDLEKTGKPYYLRKARALIKDDQTYKNLEYDCAIELAKKGMDDLATEVIKGQGNKVREMIVSCEGIVTKLQKYQEFGKSYNTIQSEKKSHFDEVLRDYKRIFGNAEYDASSNGEKTRVLSKIIDAQIRSGIDADALLKDFDVVFDKDTPRYPKESSNYKKLLLNHFRGYIRVIKEVAIKRMGGQEDNDKRRGNFEKGLDNIDKLLPFGGGYDQAKLLAEYAQTFSYPGGVVDRKEVRRVLEKAIEKNGTKPQTEESYFAQIDNWIQIAKRYNDIGDRENALATINRINGTHLDKNDELYRSVSAIFEKIMEKEMEGRLSTVKEQTRNPKIKELIGKENK